VRVKSLAASAGNIKCKLLFFYVKYLKFLFLYKFCDCFRKSLVKFYKFSAPKIFFVFNLFNRALPYQFQGPRPIKKESWRTIIMQKKMENCYLTLNILRKLFTGTKFRWLYFDNENQTKFKFTREIFVPVVTSPHHQRNCGPKFLLLFLYVSKFNYLPFIS